MKRIAIVALILASLSSFAQQNGAQPIELKARSLTLELADPPVPVSSATVQRSSGNPGLRTLYYWLVTRTAAGASSPAGPFELRRAPDALSATATVSVGWAPVANAFSYDVLRTDSAAVPQGVCNCAVITGVTGTSATDQSDLLLAYTVSTLQVAGSTVTLTNEANGLMMKRGGQPTSLVTGGLNGDQFADAAAGADAGAKINAAITNCKGSPNCSGEVVSNTGGAISSPIEVGGSSNYMRLRFGPQTRYTINNTDGGDVFRIRDRSGVDCGIPGNFAFAGSQGFVLGSAANVKSVFAPYSREGNQDSVYVRNCVIAGNATATVTGALFDVQGTFIGSAYENINIWGPYNTIGFRVRPGTGANGGLKIASDLLFQNLQSNGGRVAGGRPCVITNKQDDGTSFGYAVGNIGLVMGGCQHPGAGFNAFDIDGAGYGSSTYNSLGVNGIFLFAHHLEGGTGTADLLNIRDALDVMAWGLPLSGQYANGIHLSESSSNLTAGIRMFGLHTSTEGAVTVKNDITGRDVASMRVSEYGYKNNVFHDSFTIRQNDLILPWNDTEVPTTYQWNSATQSGDFLKVLNHVGTAQFRLDYQGGVYSLGSGKFVGKSSYYTQVDGNGLSSLDGSANFAPVRASVLRGTSCEVNNVFGTTPPINGCYIKGQVKTDGGVLLNNISTTGKALCLKADKTIGYCSSTVDASGNCTCN